MAETNALSLFPYAAELFGGMIDLLQLERITATSPPPRKPTELPEPDPGDQKIGIGSRKTKVRDNNEGDGQDENTGPTSRSPPMTMDSHPTLANSGFPPLRWAALHFLALLIRARVSRIYHIGPAGMIPNAYFVRARTTLDYVASTGEDGVVRVMAGEAREGKAQLSSALLRL